MRGKIKHRERSRQINDFSNLALPYNITPTDIDGLIEYRNEKYIFFEVKYRDAPMPYGQKLALERLVADTSMGRKKAIAIVCEHDVHDTADDVDVSQTFVREVYSYRTKEWRVPVNTYTTKQLIELFILV